MYEISNLLMENFLGPQDGMDRAGDKGREGVLVQRKSSRPGEKTGKTLEGGMSRVFEGHRGWDTGMRWRCSKLSRK